MALQNPHPTDKFDIAAYFLFFSPLPMFLISSDVLQSFEDNML